MRNFDDGDFIFGVEFDALNRALANGDMVQDGCEVTDGGTNDMTVDSASGEVTVGHTPANASAQSITLDAASSSIDRYDLVTRDSDGNIGKVTGSQHRVTPDIPANEVLIAVVEVPQDATGVTDSNIYDSRWVYTTGAGSGFDADKWDGREDPSDVDGSELSASGGTSMQVLEASGGSAQWEWPVNVLRDYHEENLDGSTGTIKTLNVRRGQLIHAGARVGENSNGDGGAVTIKITYTDSTTESLSITVVEQSKSWDLGARQIQAHEGRLIDQVEFIEDTDPGGSTSTTQQWDVLILEGCRT